MCGSVKCVLAASVLLAVPSLPAADGSVDFSKVAGAVRPALHASGFGPRLTGRDVSKGADLRALNLSAARTHDWALVDRGQRVCDTHFIFPLMRLDPKDPSNYYFKPTDELLRRTRDMGLGVFYRLGTSIEHTGDVFFNTAVPEDDDKYAEVLAGIVRHYTRGWADGFKWDIRYWEIWNEPDGIKNMWRMPGPDGKDPQKMRERFIRFYVTVLRRLKSEFPEQKVGGPALCSYDEEYFEPLLVACRDAGVAPDFISWHEYGNQPDKVLAVPAKARALCDQLGFVKTELVVNEWHYLPHDSAWVDYAGTKAVRDRLWKGPTGQNGVDSAVYTLSILSGYHATPLDQAYFYGCGRDGAWGYMNQDGTFNKTYYALKMFGRIVASCERYVASESARDGLRLFGAKGKVGCDDMLLVADFRGRERLLEIAVDGLPDCVTVREAYALDGESDMLPVQVGFRDGKLTIVKRDLNSSAYLVIFGDDSHRVLAP